MNKIVESFELYGKQYRLETGELAKQATGAVLVTQGDTTVLVTAVISNQEKDYDFFPLTVDYIEKMYAVGRIPGGYLKREGNRHKQKQYSLFCPESEIENKHDEKQQGNDHCQLGRGFEGVKKQHDACKSTYKIKRSHCPTAIITANRSTQTKPK